MTASNETRRVRLEPFSGAAGLSALRADWLRLLAESHAHPVFNGPEWVLAWTRAFADPEQLFGWTALDAESRTPVGLIALSAMPSTGLLDPRRAALVSAGTWDSDYRELLVRPGFEAPVAEALLDALARPARGMPRTDALFLPAVRADSPVLNALRAAAERRKLPTRELEVPTLVAELAEDLDAQLRRLKPRMRSKVRSASRRVAEAGARFQLCEDAGELDERLEELFELHGARWRAAGEPGSFEDTRRRAFYRDVAAHLLATGALRLARLDLDGRTIAAQFGFVSEGAYHQIQEGYDPELGELRLGIALRAASLEALLAEGVTRYDFLAGDARHKRDWGAEPVSCLDWTCALAGWRGRLAFGLRALGDRLRSVSVDS